MNRSQTVIDAFPDEAELLSRIKRAFSLVLQKVGSTKTLPDTDVARREIRRDVFDGSEARYLEWRNAQDFPCGHVLLYPDGLIYAEHDVLIRHPALPGRFIEAVTAWGPLGQLKAELRLLPMPGVP